MRTVLSMMFSAALATVAATRALSRGVSSWIRSSTAVAVTIWSDSASATPAITSSSGCSGASVSANVSVSNTRIRANTARFAINNTRQPSTTITQASQRRQRGPARGLDSVAGSVTCALGGLLTVAP
jgi:hypothetical protein